MGADPRAVAGHGADVDVKGLGDPAGRVSGPAIRLLLTALPLSKVKVTGRAGPSGTMAASVTPALSDRPMANPTVLRLAWSTSATTQGTRPIPLASGSVP